MLAIGGRRADEQHWLQREEAWPTTGQTGGRDPVRSSYVSVTGPADLFAAARVLSVRTMVFDVEPLVARWHSSQESLDRA
jgi:hypothetical protein